MFHSIFSFLVRSNYFSLFRFLLFLLCYPPKRLSSLFDRFFFFLFFLFLFFFFFWQSHGLVIWPRLGDPFVALNPRKVCVSHSPGWIPGREYTTFSYGPILILLHNFHRVSFPTQSYQDLHSICANLQHSIILWYIGLSLSLLNQYLLFCCT